MAVYVSNDTGKFVSLRNWMIQLLDCAGNTKWKKRLYKTIGEPILTPQGISPRKYPEYEGANNMFVIGSPKTVAFKGWDYKKYGQPRFRQAVRLHKHGDYNEGDIFELVNPDGRVVSRFPEPGASAGKECVPASPRLIRRVATTWAGLKGR